MAIVLLAACTLSAAQDKKGDASGKKASPLQQWKAAETVAKGIVGPLSGLPLDAAANRRGNLALCWTEGRIGGYKIVLAERGDNGWRSIEVTKTDRASIPEPRIRLLPAGEIAVAWGGSDGTPGGGLFRRTTDDDRGSVVAPIHEKCTGGVAFLGPRDSVRLVYLRGVRLLDLAKLAGNFIHDRPLQDYEKPAVGRLVEGRRWREERLLDAKSYLRASDFVALRHDIIWYRSGEGHDEELVHVDLEETTPVPVAVAKHAELGPFRLLAAARSKRGILVAFDGKDGIHLKERVGAKWRDHGCVLPGDYGELDFASRGSELHLLAIENVTFRVVYARKAGDRWTKRQVLGRGRTCALALRGNRPVVFWTRTGAVFETILSRQDVVVRQGK